MANVERLRKQLLDKIAGTEDEALLEALDKIVSSNDTLSLSEAQLLIMKLSEQDVMNKRVITQENLVKRNLS